VLEQQFKEYILGEVKNFKSEWAPKNKEKEKSGNQRN